MFLRHHLKAPLLYEVLSFLRSYQGGHWSGAHDDITQLVYHHCPALLLDREMTGQQEEYLSSSDEEQRGKA